MRGAYELRLLRDWARWTVEIGRSPLGWRFALRVGVPRAARRWRYREERHR